MPDRYLTKQEKREFGERYFGSDVEPDVIARLNKVSGVLVQNCDLSPYRHGHGVWELCLRLSRDRTKQFYREFMETVQERWWCDEVKIAWVHGTQLAVVQYTVGYLWEVANMLLESFGEDPMEVDE